MQGNDELVPGVLKSVSSCVVGIIGNQKEDSGYSASKYSEEIVHGTGVIIKSNGEILTNAHVVKSMDKIVVVLSDGSGYEATLKCIDEDTDLALIKINKSNLNTARFGKEEDIVIGRTVLAIGTPVSLSLRNSASIGIISGINRGIGSPYSLIQTDAAINPGNSGGPLVNLKGEVIGINSSKFAAPGIEGLGFSIPLNTINYVLKQFEINGKVKRPYLGANFEEDWAARVGLPTNSGLRIRISIKIHRLKAMG
jgi:serine protease Do